MPSRHHVLIPLPHGRDPRDPAIGRLSVLIVPRLTGERTGDLSRRHSLTDYPDDWARWPQVLLGDQAAGRRPLGFDVAVNGSVQGGNAGIDIRSPRWVSPAPVPAAWRDLFRLAGGAPGIDVDRFRPLDQRQVPLAPMYDAAALAALLHDLHDQLATAHPTAPPTAAQLGALAPFQAIQSGSHLDDYAAHLEPLGDGDDDEEDEEPIDFHQAIGLLQAHPRLLRLLGLVVDLAVRLPPNQVVQSVAVRTDYESMYDAPGPNPDPDQRAREVRTRTTVTRDFWPATGDAAFVDFWARVGTGDHVVGTLDIPTAVANLSDLVDPAGATDATHAGVADTAGLYVARPGSLLTGDVEERFERQASFEQSVRGYLQVQPPPGPIPIDARDVAVGLRYDVFDETTQRWYSLWERQPRDGVVRFPQSLDKLQLPLGDDESWLTVTSFTEAAPDVIRPDGTIEQPLPPAIDKTPQRVSPTVFAWRGWSLAARPPGKALSMTTGAVQQTPSTPPDDAPLQAEIQYEVPDGVLPRLRYGRRYKLRARVVDYAGNSHPLGASHPRDEDAETDPVPFGRVAPVASPVVVRRGLRPVPGWGDHPTTLVIRNELAPPDEDAEPTERIVLPPGTAVERCVLHGRPEPDGMFTDAAVFDEIARRDAADVDDALRLDPASGELIAGSDAWRPAIPYLPDVAAAGVSVVGLPGHDEGEVVAAAYTGDWPARAGFGVRVEGGDRRASLSPTGDEPALVCYVPKGITRTVEIASTVEEATLGHWSIVARADADQQRALARPILDGRHWMVSARAALTLVHAVRLPLTLPTLTNATAGRPGVDDRRIALTATLGIDVKSTARVDVIIAWTDPVDRGGPDGVEQATTRQLLFSQHEEYAEDGTRALDDTPYDGGDTKRHQAVVTLEAFSRYSRHFAQRETVRFSSPGAHVSFHGGPVATGNVEVSTDEGPLVIGRDVIVDARAGTIAHHERGNAPVGADVHVDFVPLPISRTSTEAGDGTGEWSVLVPNSGVPDAIGVRETLPAFARTVTTRSDDEIEIRHEGRVVRVWLERPWFTTGEGELLGVVVDPGVGFHDTLHTRVGRDPLTARTGELTIDGFPRATATMDDVDGTGLTVHGHEVAFDEESQRWFADVELAGALGYRPFVQLSLARFQPESVPGAHVGDTVMSEPVRFGPTRRVFARRQGNRVEVEVIGLGPRNRVTVQLQRRDRTIHDDDLGWVDDGAPVELPASTSRGGWLGDLRLPEGDEGYRLVVIDAELLDHRSGDQVPVTAYVETIPLPDDWRAIVAPPAVTGLRGEPGYESIRVEWDAVPGPDGRNTTSYVVEVQPHRGTPTEHPTQETELVIDGLTGGVRHDVRVAARYGETQGPWSDSISLTPLERTEPARITDLDGEAGVEMVTLWWGEPDDGGGGNLRYLVEERVGNGSWTSIDADADRLSIAPPDERGIVTATVEELRGGVTHRYRVSAANDVGTARPSNTVTLVPLEDPTEVGRPPGQVIGLVADPDVGEVTLRWTAPADGGDPAGYEVDLAPGDKGRAVWLEHPIRVDGTSYAVTDLEEGEGYRFRVRAVNEHGVGDWSDVVATTTLADEDSTVVAAPARITDLVATAGPDTGDVTLAWTSPPDPDHTITGYELQWRDGNAQWAPFPVDDDDIERTDAIRQLLVTGLTPGVRYRFQVRAVNGSDEPARWSPTATVVAS